jgi:hypothetical protein
MLNVSAGAVVDTCGNCGAPLDLDESGACRWCHARLVVEQPAPRVAHHAGGTAGLVPAEADDCSSSAPFLYLMLAVLGPLFSYEPAVQEYVHRQPGLRQQIRDLAMAVSAAGVRVRDDGLLKDDFDMNLRVYTPEEIWTFDLAIDVIAVLGAVDGLPGSTRAKTASDLRSLEQEAHSHTWKKDLRKAGTGPEAFQGLRGRIPHRS